METILMPTDFSDVSKNALKFAIKIAHTQRSKIVLLHAVPPIVLPIEADAMREEDAMEKEIQLAAEKMDSWLAFCTEHHAAAESFIKVGLLVDVVTDYAQHHPVDLLVTGMHEVHGISRWLGTNSMTMFRDVNCPVLIVPSEAKYHGIKRVLYATDLEFGDVEELKRVCELAQPFNATVTAVHINTSEKYREDEEENMLWFAEMVDERIPYNQVNYRTVYNQDVLDGLSKAINDWNIDLLCMSTVEKNFMQRIFTESTSRQMAYHSHLPVLLAHLNKHHKLSDVQ